MHKIRVRGFTRKCSVQFLPKGALGNCLLFDIFSSSFFFSENFGMKKPSEPWTPARLVQKRLAPLVLKSAGGDALPLRYTWYMVGCCHLVIFWHVTPWPSVTLQISYDNITTKYASPCYQTNFPDSRKKKNGEMLLNKGEIPFVASVVSKIVHGRAFGRVGNGGETK